MQKLQDFFKEHGAKGNVIELMIDASYKESDMTPCLEVIVWKVGEDAFREAMANATTNDDTNFIYDVVDEAARLDGDLWLDRFYPNWPDDPPESDEKLKEDIKSIAKASGITTPLYFHHADVLPWELITS